MEPDLPRYVVTSKCTTKWLTKADLRNSSKNTWNMHARRDIIRSQMFYSVYTKVTRCNHQRTSAHTNLAQPVLVSKLPEEKAAAIWTLMGCEGVFLKIIYGSFSLYVWSNNALTDLLSYKFSLCERQDQLLKVNLRERFPPWWEATGLNSGVEGLGAAWGLVSFRAIMLIWTKIKGSRLFYPPDKMQPSWQCIGSEWTSNSTSSSLVSSPLFPR